MTVAHRVPGAGFGLAVPVLNTYTSVFHPGRVDRAVLVLNARRRARFDSDGKS
jgi:hypothetical protein